MKYWTQKSKILITCPKGIPPWLAGEVRALGFPVLAEGEAAVETEGTLADTMPLNLHLRTGHRVLYLVADLSGGEPRRPLPRPAGDPMGGDPPRTGGACLPLGHLDGGHPIDQRRPVRQPEGEGRDRRPDAGKMRPEARLGTRPGPGGRPRLLAGEQGFPLPRHLRRAPLPAGLPEDPASGADAGDARRRGHPRDRLERAAGLRQSDVRERDARDRGRAFRAGQGAGSSPEQLRLHPSAGVRSGRLAGGPGGGAQGGKGDGGPDHRHGHRPAGGGRGQTERADGRRAGADRIFRLPLRRDADSRSRAAWSSSIPPTASGSARFRA